MRWQVEEKDQIIKNLFLSAVNDRQPEVSSNENALNKTISQQYSRMRIIFPRVEIHL